MAKNDVVDFGDPNIDQWVKDFVTDQFNRYYDNKPLDESELSVCQICEGFYPEDRSKQEVLAYVVIRSTMESDPTDFKKILETTIMPLAIEHGVEDVIIQEILNVKGRKVIDKEIKTDTD